VLRSAAAVSRVFFSGLVSSPLRLWAESSSFVRRRLLPSPSVPPPEGNCYLCGLVVFGLIVACRACSDWVTRRARPPLFSSFNMMLRQLGSPYSVSPPPHPPSRQLLSLSVSAKPDSLISSDLLLKRARYEDPSFAPRACLRLSSPLLLVI